MLTYTRRFIITCGGNTQREGNQTTNDLLHYQKLGKLLLNTDTNITNKHTYTNQRCLFPHITSDQIWQCPMVFTSDLFEFLSYNPFGLQLSSAGVAHLSPVSQYLKTFLHVLVKSWNIIHLWWSYLPNFLHGIGRRFFKIYLFLL